MSHHILPHILVILCFDNDIFFTPTLRSILESSCLFTTPGQIVIMCHVSFSLVYNDLDDSPKIKHFNCYSSQLCCKMQFFIQTFDKNELLILEKIYKTHAYKFFQNKKTFLWSCINYKCPLSS